MRFPQRWDDGTEAGTPDYQVHWYDESTAIIRQALRTNFEGPFSYLLLGAERALLLDTGTGHIDLCAVVEELLGERDLELVVAHTHGHRDHIGGDSQFADRPGTVLVGTSAAEVASYFGLDEWPQRPGRYDLGGRMLDVIPIPGHEGSDLAFYDPATRILFTGDSLYPGRLYVPDWAAYRASIDRLARFVADGPNPVEWVLGAHIEMTDQPGRDYPMGADVHPGEHQLQLGPEVLTELAEVLEQAGPEPRHVVRDHFVVVPR
ncbi:MBL fold metallo-hydrolase [Kribbella deserti]|uniref:MBL fold metallo-hydrolase n=1 Tax=Kribbella deserti TaxID=1926257 RepID=A0ABV6QLT7_9ACTN